MAFMGVVIAGLLVILVALLLRSTPAAAPVAVPPTANPVGSAPTTAPAPDGSAAPRMALADFKALYDNPAKRPMIVDVRAADAFAQGHIVGAVNIPEADIDTRYKEIPKDRLVIAYCQ